MQCSRSMEYGIRRLMSYHGLFRMFSNIWLQVLPFITLSDLSLVL